MTRVIGFDISYRTGWAVLEKSDLCNYGARVVCTGNIPEDISEADRIKMHFNGVYHTDKVVVENVIVAPKGNKLYSVEVAKRIGGIRDAASRLGKEFVEIYPNTMRSFVKKGKRIWIECSKCHAVVSDVFKTEVKARTTAKKIKQFEIVCPACGSKFKPRVKTEGKEPIIQFVKEIDPSCNAVSDDADAVVIALMGGYYFGVFDQSGLDERRKEVIQRILCPEKKKKKKVKRGKVIRLPL